MSATTEEFRRFKVVMIEDDQEAVDQYIKIIAFGVRFPNDRCAIQYVKHGRILAAGSIADVEESLVDEDGTVATVLEWID